MKGSNWIPAHVLPEQVKIHVFGHDDKAWRLIEIQVFVMAKKDFFSWQEIVYLLQVTREYIYDLLYSAKEANMNMLRVGN